MWKRTILVTAITLGVGTSAAFAQTTQTPPPAAPVAPAVTPDRHQAGINAREARQEARIKDAKKDGELTKGELDKLRGDEAALRAKEKVFRDSGKGLDSQEYKDLEKNLDSVSKQIKRAAHNGRKGGDGL